MRPAQAYEEDEATPNGAEFSLGMGTLIGIFFGLAMVCGVFFGFGYMLGHRSPNPSASSQPSEESPRAANIPAVPKPSAQVAAQPGDASRIVLPFSQPSDPASSFTGEADDPPPAREKVQAAQLKPIASPPQPAAPRAATAPAPSSVAAIQSATLAQAGTIMVQIAAVKNRPDAEALADALRKNGFSPTIRNESQDKLLHVQIGPFASRDDAKSMRQKLSAAGYDAFIK